MAPTAINTTKYQLPANEYIAHPPGPVTYDQLVLHYTAGSTANGAFNGWVTDRDAKGNRIRVCTAWIIDVDGTKYQVFDPKKGWGWHIGPVVTETQNKRALGIEVANLGWLTLAADGSKLQDYLKRNYCTLADAGKYVKRPKWRGYEYWIPFTSAQLQALRELTVYVCDTFNIPKVLLPKEKRMEICLADAVKHKGIVCHHNFLGKYDIGPQVDLEWLIS